MVWVVEHKTSDQYLTTGTVSTRYNCSRDIVLKTFSITFNIKAQIITKPHACNIQICLELKKLNIFWTNILIFFAEAVLMSTHNLCFGAKKKKEKQVYPCIPQFFYVKMGFKGVYISRICFPDGRTNARVS